MLTKIGEALGGWSPRRSGGDPLSVIRANWTTLVGADVARAAQPVAVAGDTLVIITNSSAWSHQLAFLEPEILRGIRSHATSAAIMRLRFRVGTIRARPRPELSTPGVPGTKPSVATKGNVPHTAAEALARFRATVERSRAVHRERGGRFCSSCSAPLERGDRCRPCADWARLELEASCQRLLFDAPWLTPQEVLDSLPGLDAAAYDAIRRRLLRTWWDEMALARKRAALPRAINPNRVRLCKIASSYVLLETKIDPQRLEMDSPIRRNALGDLYEFIRGIELMLHDGVRRTVQKSSGQ